MCFGNPIEIERKNCSVQFQLNAIYLIFLALFCFRRISQTLNLLVLFQN